MNNNRGAWANTAVAVVAAFTAGCGSSSDSPAATPTKTVVTTATRTATVSSTTTATPAPTVLISATVSATRTSTPFGQTHTPTINPTQSAATVSGLLVVSRSIAASATDALGSPPTEWGGKADTASFNQSLAFASWSIVEVPGKQGTTGADGRFTVSGLAAGRYTLQVTKTIEGNLLASPGQSALQIPFTVGSDGNASIVAQVTWGLVRSSSTYNDGGSQVREVRSPYGNWVITRDGRISAFGDPGRTFVDDNGDGRFSAEPCVDQVWECGANPTCGADRVCACTASCPFCDDCGPGVCIPPGSINAYRCNVDGACTLPGDKCVCVSSCPACDDCPRKVCVPGCADVQITALSITSGPAQLVAGRQGQAYASATLSDGSQFDVTYLADWQSSNDSVATVDSWGTVSALAVGAADLTATIGSLTSAPFHVDVVEHPTLQEISIQNQSCFCGPVYLGGPAVDAAVRPCLLDAPARPDVLPVPSCTQVVQIGATLQFTAIGRFADGSYEDLTKTVAWHVAPAEIGDVVEGVFTASVAGTAQLTASLGAVSSNATEIRVVTEPTVISLSIYPDTPVYAVASGGPVAGGVALPCAAAPAGADLCCCPGPVGTNDAPCGCGFSITVLRGDHVTFHATAQYDTGDWRDVTAQVTWRTTNSAAATIDSAGGVTAVDAGDAAIDAVFEGVTSNPVGVHVVDHATLLSLSVYQEGTDRVLQKGDQAFFHASGFYDVGFSRDVTKAATWRSSNDSAGSFDTNGVFTAHAAGTVFVWAELDGQQSNSLSLEVFETSTLTYCDPAHVNRAAWSDNYNRVILESDCAAYQQPAIAELRYTVTEIQPHGGIFDPCLDLYVYHGNTRVRTIREEGCGDPFLPSSAPGRDAEALKYQLRAFWDLKDDRGQPVADGTYTVFGRFYLYYDPVVSISLRVGANVPDDTLPDLVPSEVHLGICSVASCVPEQLMDVCVANLGGSTATGFAVSINSMAVFFGALVAGEQQCAAVPFAPQVTVVADASDEVVEQREDNNQREFSVPTPVPTACDFVPPDCTPSLPTSTPTPDGGPQPVCTPPLCQPGEVFSCPGACSGGCGTICVTPRPTTTPQPPPPNEGACFRGPEACIGPSFPTSQERCCQVLQLSASLLPVTWCPKDALDPSGQCNQCSNPCAGLQPSPTPTVCNPSFQCPSGQVKVCDPTRCDDATSCFCEFVPTTVTPTPMPTPPGSESGVCYEQVNCAPLPYATHMSQASCCSLARNSTGLPFSWCSSAAIDQSTGLCAQCVSHPCLGIPSPTPTSTSGLFCLRGTHMGASCTHDSECPGSLCVATTYRCSYGTWDAAPCVSNGDCPGGYCFGAPTPTPEQPVCTPPPCGPGESFFCPHYCPGGCGTQCATPLPTPSPFPVEGACFQGAQPCTGESFLTSQEHCCDVLRLSFSQFPVTWCPSHALDPGGQCSLCGNPCAGLPPSPTPTVCDPGPPCSNGQVKICDPARSCDDATSCFCEFVPPTPTPVQ